MYSFTGAMVTPDAIAIFAPTTCDRPAPTRRPGPPNRWAEPAIATRCSISVTADAGVRPPFYDRCQIPSTLRPKAVTRACI